MNHDNIDEIWLGLVLFAVPSCLSPLPGLQPTRHLARPSFNADNESVPCTFHSKPMVASWCEVTAGIYGADVALLH